jgi:hypothetical protein
VKATPGKVYHCLAGNIATTAAYLKFYDMATAPAATDTPIYVVLIPAGGSQPVDIPAGLPFATGIGIRASKLQANADTTAPDGNVTVSLLYA